MSKIFSTCKSVIFDKPLRYEALTSCLNFKFAFTELVIFSEWPGPHCSGELHSASLGLQDLQTWKPTEIKVLN